MSVGQQCVEKIVMCDNMLDDVVVVCDAISQRLKMCNIKASPIVHAQSIDHIFRLLVVPTSHN